MPQRLPASVRLPKPPLTARPENYRGVTAVAVIKTQSNSVLSG